MQMSWQGEQDGFLQGQLGNWSAHPACMWQMEPLLPGSWVQVHGTDVAERQPPLRLVEKEEAWMKRETETGPGRSRPAGGGLGA